MHSGTARASPFRHFLVGFPLVFDRWKLVAHNFDDPNLLLLIRKPLSLFQIFHLWLTVVIRNQDMCCDYFQLIFCDYYPTDSFFFFFFSPISLLCSVTPRIQSSCGKCVQFRFIEFLVFDYGSLLYLLLFFCSGSYFSFSCSDKISNLISKKNFKVSYTWHDSKTD